MCIIDVLFIARRALRQAYWIKPTDARPLLRPLRVRFKFQNILALVFSSAREFLCLCAGVLVCVCMLGCLPVYLYVRTYGCSYVCSFSCICMAAYLRVCVTVVLYVSVRVCVFVCVCVLACLCVCRFACL